MLNTQLLTPSWRTVSKKSFLITVSLIVLSYVVPLIQGLISGYFLCDNSLSEAGGPVITHHCNFNDYIDQQEAALFLAALFSFGLIPAVIFLGIFVPVYFVIWLYYIFKLNVLNNQKK